MITPRADRWFSPPSRPIHHPLRSISIEGPREKDRDMSEPNFIDTHAAAKLLGFQNTATFMDNLDRLRGELHFPDPVPWHKQKRWRRDEVLAWMDESRRTPAPAPSNLSVVQ